MNTCGIAEGLAYEKYLHKNLAHFLRLVFSYKVLFLDMPGDTIPTSSSSYPLTNNNHFDSTPNPSVPRRALTVTSRMASGNQEENAKVNHDNKFQNQFTH